MPATPKATEISLSEFARRGRFRSLRSAYEPVWLGLVRARKSNGKWWIDAESADRHLKALNRTPTSRSDPATTTEESLAQGGPHA